VVVEIIDELLLEPSLIRVSIAVFNCIADGSGNARSISSQSRNNVPAYRSADGTQSASFIYHQIPAYNGAAQPIAAAVNNTSVGYVLTLSSALFLLMIM